MGLTTELGYYKATHSRTVAPVTPLTTWAPSLFYPRGPPCWSLGRGLGETRRPGTADRTTSTWRPGISSPAHWR